MEMLDQRVKTHLAKTAEYFQRMGGGNAQCSGTAGYFE